MNSFLRRHQTSIFVATLSVFFGGMFVGFGGYWFTDRDMQGVVARIGKEKITNQDLMVRVDHYADQMREQGKELDDAKLAELKRELLTSMMVDELLSMKAKELGLVVTDEELARDIRSTPAFGRDGHFDDDVYFSAVRAAFRQTPQEYERERRKALNTARLKRLFFELSKVSPAELREAYGAANKGSFKNFDKEKDAFAQRLQQSRALDLINQCLRRMQSTVEVQNLLDRVDSGA